MRKRLRQVVSGVLAALLTISSVVFTPLTAYADDKDYTPEWGNIANEEVTVNYVKPEEKLVNGVTVPALPDGVSMPSNDNFAAASYERTLIQLDIPTKTGTTTVGKRTFQYTFTGYKTTVAFESYTDESGAVVDGKGDYNITDNDGSTYPTIVIAAGSTGHIRVTAQATYDVRQVCNINFTWTNGPENLQVKDIPETMLSGTKLYLPAPLTEGTTYIDSSNGATYEWQGWYVNKVKKDDNSSITVEDDVNIEGRWKIVKAPTTYTVKWYNGDTLLETDSNVSYGTTPSYDGTTPTKATIETDTQKTEYTFVGWSKDKDGTSYISKFGGITGNTTYYAVFQETITKKTSKDTVTVTWKWGNGPSSYTIEGTNVIAFGDIITLSPPSILTDGKVTDPVNKHTYTFMGWSLNGGDVMGWDGTSFHPMTYSVEEDTTITAVWRDDGIDDSSKVTITWADGDGNAIQVDKIATGTVPEYTGATPTKAEDSKYTYEFIGWSTEKNSNTYISKFGTVTADTTFYAQFQKTEKPEAVTTCNISVDWQGPDNIQFVFQSPVAYGTTLTLSAPSVKSYTDPTTGYVYTWVGWYIGSKAYGDTDSVKITKDTTFIGKWNVEKDATRQNFTVTWANYDGTTLYTETVKAGTTPVYSGTTPQKSADSDYTYEFAGWNNSSTAEDWYVGDLPSVNANVTFYAKYSRKVRSQNTCAITWDWQGPSSYQLTNLPSTISSGSSIRLPTIDTKSITDSSTGDVYTWNGWYIDNTKYDNGATVKITEDTTISGRWDVTRTKVNEYTVKWVLPTDDGEKILETDTGVKAGEQPIYNGEAPEKENDENYVYNFSGWSSNKTATKGAANDKLPGVTKDTTYYAIFTKTARKGSNYSIVTWKNYDGTVLETDELQNNSAPDYKGNVPLKSSTAQYSYQFKGWSTAQDSTSYTDEKSLPKVTGDVTYYAVFQENLRSYTITWMNNDGKVKVKTTQVEYGKIPTYEGLETPTKASSGDENYKFIGWSTKSNVVVDASSTYTPTACKGNTTYYAVFLRVQKQYTVVQWLNADNSVLKEVKVERGTSTSDLTYDGTPTYTNDSNCDYTFTGWSDPVTVTDTDGSIISISYIAQYTKTPKAPTSFLNNVENSGVLVHCKSGDHLDVDNIVFDGSFTAGTVKQDASGNYTVDVTLTDLSEYQRVFNMFSSNAIHKNATATVGTLTLTWDSTSNKWTAPREFEVTVECAKHTVKYAYMSNLPAEVANKYPCSFTKSNVYTGNSVTVAGAPTTESYVIGDDKWTFAGWKLKTPSSLTGVTVDDVEGLATGTFIMPDSDVEFIGIWVKNSVWHTITFKADNGGTFADGETKLSYKVREGSAFPTVPNVKENEHYNPSGWYDQDGNKVDVFPAAVPTKDMTYTAKFSAETFTIRYADGVDQKAFAEQLYQVAYGEKTPAFNGVPKRDGYVFDGWTPAISEKVTGNVNYIAKWKEASSAAISSGPVADAVAKAKAAPPTGIEVPVLGITFLAAAVAAVTGLVTVRRKRNHSAS